MEKLSNGALGSVNDDLLSEALREHILCGEKASSFFKVSAAELSRFREVVSSIRLDQSAFTTAYPAIIEEARLHSLSKNPSIVAIEQNDFGIGIVYSSVRTVSVRSVLTAADLDQDFNLPAGYDEIIGIKNTRWQAFDIIWLPTRGEYIEIRIDFPQGMLVSQAEYVLQGVTEAANALLHTTLPPPENLHPLMLSMYADEKEGQVVELAFGASTAALRHERMRRSGLDLRKEAYHVAGKAALAAGIEPHRLSLTWRRRVDEARSSRPELTLAGDARSAGGPNAMIRQAFIRKCTSAEDYNFVGSRIAHHLPSLAA